MECVVSYPRWWCGVCGILPYVIGVECVVSYPRRQGWCVWYLTLGGRGEVYGILP